ncbi:MAG: hypothetical protein KDD56_10610 [Bdellovibrionales bacterium]|nr:hypothetical protein [Bdellovibrionales bacterium]
MTENSQRLQVKVLSDHGEVVTQVNCPKGSITVLRGYKQSDLEPFKSAFAGIPGPERIVINVNNAPYEREENILIGFGENDLIPEVTVEDFFAKFMSTSAVEPLLFSYGLDGIAKKTLSSLPSDEKRRVQILSALYQEGKAVILNLPFEPIATSWREKYASYLLEQCVANDKILVVVNLDYRPECWVDNPNIIRIQLGEDVHKTIGFGAGNSGINELIQNIRTSIKQDETLGQAVERVQKESAPRPVNEDRDRKTTAEVKEKLIPPLIDPGLFSKLLKPIAACMFALLITLIYLTNNKAANLNANNHTKNSTQSKEFAKTPVKSPKREVASNAVPDYKQVINRPEISPNVIDLYPTAIKQSLLSALRNPNPPFLQSAEIKKPTIKKSAVDQQAASLLSALQDLSGTAPESLNSAEDNTTSLGSSAALSYEEREERREIIRQKFLEAIQKASAS